MSTSAAAGATRHDDSGDERCGGARPLLEAIAGAWRAQRDEPARALEQRALRHEPGCALDERAPREQPARSLDQRALLDEPARALDAPVLRDIGLHRETEASHGAR